jgi:rare lipoprotein A
VARAFIFCLTAVLLLSTPSESRQSTPAASAEQAAPLKQKRTGAASYMAKALEGRKTASGRIYDGRELVAAHPTYPMGTVLRVTNLANGRSVEVTVVDRSARGPKRPIVDLSRAAAERLDMIEEGVVKVTTEVISARQ